MTAYSQVPTYLPDSQAHRRIIAIAVNGLIQGKSSNTSSVTLTTGTTTTVTDFRAGTNSVIVFSPTSSGGAAALSGLFVSTKNNGSFVITHASGAAGRTLDYVVVG